MWLPNNKPKMRLILIYFICILFSCSCSREDRVNKVLIKTWYIENVILDSVEYTSSVFFFNMISFEQNICIIPTFEIEGRNIAQWKYYENKQEKSKYFIEIYESPIDIFNGIFELSYEKQSNAEKLILKSERVTLFCWR